MTRYGRIVAFGCCALAIVGGAVSAALVGDGTGAVLAVALIGGGLIVATGLVFLEVGLSEDRERERDLARRRGPPARRLTPRGLSRLRGRRRHLG